MRSFKVYLAGPIAGLTYDGAEDWRSSARELIERASNGRIECYSPLRSHEHLRGSAPIVGSYEGHPISSADGITTRDRYDVMSADLVLVNFLEAKRASIGTAMEVAWADLLRKPVVAAMERSGNPHDHPMICRSIGFRVETVEAAAEVACKVLLP